MLGCKELWSLKTYLQQRLIREVLQGAADVARNEQIESERVVQVVVLEIQRDDGCLFVQIGKTNDSGAVNQIIPSCMPSVCNIKMSANSFCARNFGNSKAASASIRSKFRFA